MFEEKVSFYNNSQKSLLQFLPKMTLKDPKKPRKLVSNTPQQPQQQLEALLDQEYTPGKMRARGSFPIYTALCVFTDQCEKRNQSYEVKQGEKGPTYVWAEHEIGITQRYRLIRLIARVENL